MDMQTIIKNSVGANVKHKLDKTVKQLSSVRCNERNDITVITVIDTDGNVEELNFMEFVLNYEIIR
jgi:hypothetical protein